MTNNSIFTRVLALMICLVMLVGTLTACFQETDHNHNVGTTTNGEDTTKPTTTTTTTGDVVEDEPTEDPVDPNVIFSASTNISSDSLIYGTLANDVVIGGTEVGALVPADVKVEAGASNLALSVKKVDEELLGDALSALDVHINGIALDNTVPMIVKLGAILEAGLGATELKLYHTENGVDNLMTRVNSPADFAIHNQYYYNAETGEVTIYIASFSVISAVKSSASKWEDDTVANTSWYNENDTEFTLKDVADFLGFRNLVDGGNTFEGKTVILATDIDLVKKPFDPIGFGYYDNDDSDGKTNYRVFMGTFDGGNHTIYNLYENCWELDPDKTNYGTYTYSTAGAGLFASVKDATIKNIAINGAEVVFECVDMGVLVGYAQGECHFENIVISNANIANYNRYTGGLVGEVSYGVDNNEDGYSHTFKNITIDSTVTVSGLWGSFGCGMGGVIGGKWGTATVLMENIVSAPVMDVYNDVVSAYQWYAFRGCGMLIGHTEEPYSDGRTSGNATASFLTCKNVNVYYGDWTKYNYYEFKDQDSDTGKRYPWVRAEEGKYCEAFSNIRYGVPTHTVEGVTTAVSELSPEELEKVATDHVVITFDQLYGADRGMYGTNEHEGVNISYSSPKTFYIKNNVGWENLTLHYTYEIGEETWTTIPDGVELVEFNGVYRIDLPVGAISFTITADDGYISKEFIVSELTEKGTYPVHEHNFDSSDECACGAQKMTASVTIADYAAENGWVNEKQYKEVTIGGIKVTAVGGGNTGKYYTNGNDWRLYQSENATLKISTLYGTIVSVKVTYTSNNAGVLKLNGNNITTETEVNVNANDITFVVGNTGTATNGQARITVIEVVYIVEKHECNQNEIIKGKDATCAETGLTDGAKCDVCGKVTLEQEEIPMIAHTWNDATCEAPKTCSVCGKTEGEALAHTTENGVCENCGQVIGGTTPEVESGWIKTDIADIEADDIVVIVWTTSNGTGTSYAISNDKGTSAAPTAVVVTVNGNQLNGDIADNIKWNISNSNGDLTIYPNGTTATWLYCTSTNNGVRVGTNTNKTFTIDASSGYLKHTGTSRYLGVYTTNPDIRCYTNTTGNTANQTLAFYVYNEGTSGGDNGGNEGGDTLACEHANTTTTTTATCIAAGVETVTCDDCGETVSTTNVDALGHTTEDGTCERCGETIGGSTPAEPTVVLEITKEDFNTTSYAANNNTKTENGYSYTSYQVMNQSSVMQWQKSKGYITITSDDFVKLELKSTAGTYTVTVGGKTVTGTTSNGVTTYDLTGLTGEIKISVGSATGKVDYIKFYK